MIRSSLTLIFATVACPFAAETLVNGGFENRLSGWNAWGGEVSSVHHGGTQACRIRSAKPGWLGVDQSIAIPKGSRTAKVIGWLRADSLHAGKETWERGRLGVEFRTVKGDTVGGYPLAVGQVRGTIPWMKVVRTYQIPSGADSLKVQCALGNSSGTLYCDDISVEFAK